MRLQNVLYRVLFVFLSSITISFFLYGVLAPPGIIASTLGTIAYQIEPTHGIILTLVVRKIVESSKQPTVDIGVVTKLTKKKPSNNGNLMSILNPDTAVIQSNNGTKIINSSIE